MFDYVLFYRDVRRPRIEVCRGVIKVVVPKGFKDVDDFVYMHRGWIEDKVRCLKELEVIARDLVLYDRDDIREVIDRYVREYGGVLGVKPSEVLFRRMRVRWGSCNFREGRIIFNRDLRFLPEGLIRYVVLHEMCHLVVPNHGRDFWRLVGRFDSDYREKEKLLISYRFRLDGLGG